MSENIRDPYVALTGFDQDLFVPEKPRMADAQDVETEDADDELRIEEDRAREG